jgi:hypothetical protein
MTDKKLPASHILYEDPSTWVMSLDELEKWIGDFPQHPGDLALGFCSLKRWLTEHTDDAAIRPRSLALAGRFLDEASKWLTGGKPSNADLCLLFGALMTLIGEAGPYRYETRRDPSGKLDQDIRGPMADIRFRAVDVSKALFGRREFDRLRESIDAEIIPLLEAAIEAHGGESDRFMPFRIIEVSMVAEQLLKLATWLAAADAPQPDDA